MFSVTVLPRILQMSILKKLFAPKHLSPPEKILGAMQTFTQPAFLMLPPSDYDTDQTRTKRVFVFLFGAIDSLMQHHGITGNLKSDILTTFLRQTFPAMSDASLQSAASFLGSASADPSWRPIMIRGAESITD